MLFSNHRDLPREFQAASDRIALDAAMKAASHSHRRYEYLLCIKFYFRLFFLLSRTIRYRSSLPLVPRRNFIVSLCFVDNRRNLHQLITLLSDLKTSLTDLPIYICERGIMDKCGPFIFFHLDPDFSQPSFISWNDLNCHEDHGALFGYNFNFLKSSKAIINLKFVDLNELERYWQTLSPPIELSEKEEMFLRRLELAHKRHNRAYPFRTSSFTEEMINSVSINQMAIDSDEDSAEISEDSPDSSPVGKLIEVWVLSAAEEKIIPLLGSIVDFDFETNIYVIEWDSYPFKNQRTLFRLSPDLELDREAGDVSTVPEGSWRILPSPVVASLPKKKRNHEFYEDSNILPERNDNEYQVTLPSSTVIYLPDAVKTSETISGILNRLQFANDSVDVSYREKVLSRSYSELVSFFERGGAVEPLGHFRARHQKILLEEIGELKKNFDGLIKMLRTILMC